MLIYIFTEDTLNEPYQILAKKVLDFYRLSDPTLPNCTIRVAQVRVNELVSFDELLDLTRRALRSGASQVIFMMDHEGPAASSERVQARNEFQRAFSQLCAHLQDLGDNEPLKRVKVVRLEVQSCLESWLLAHPQAIVASAGGTSRYDPRARNTENLTPKQARDQIAHILQEVGRRSGRNHLRKVSGHSVKSWGKKIAQHLDVSEAQQYNYSFRYFCEMIDRDQDGCENPFSIGENHA